MPTSITGQGISVYPAPDDALSSTSKNPVQNKVIDEEFSDFNRQLSDVEDRLNNATSVYIEDGRSTSSNYYKQVTPFSTQKQYMLGVTVPITQAYTLQSGNTMSASAMVDTIFTGDITANTETLIGPYIPTGSYKYLRLDKNLSWSVKVYEVYDNIAQTLSTALLGIADSLKLKEISTTEFAALPYSYTIGNIEYGTIVRLTASYNAVDYPQNNPGIYTIITCGSSDRPVQIAIYANNGNIFTRAKTSLGWTVWKNFDGVYSSNIVIRDNSTYQSFDDFPVGSILVVRNTVELNDAPPGWNTIGHVTTDTGAINAIVMTYSESPLGVGYKAQIAHIYRASTEGAPRIAYRVATAAGWSSWSVLSEDGVLHATNKVVDINSYEQVTFSDFDNAPINSIYQVDYNVGNTILHNPSPGKSGILMTFAFSVSTRHGLVQMHFAFESPKAVMYFRYGFEQSASEYVWTPWEKCVTETQT